MPRFNPHIATMPLNVGGSEVQITDGELVGFEGSKPVPVTTTGWTLEYPITPGAIALTLVVPPDVSATEWREELARCWADIQLVREAQERAWRRAEADKTRKYLTEARRELEHADGRSREMLEMLRDAIPTLERRLGELEREPEAPTRVRIDLPFRELVWLRQFVGERKATGDIATDWDEQLAAWGRGVVESGDDPVLAAAYDEWKSRPRRKGAASTDAFAIERSVKRWLGKTLGPNPQIRADPTALGGYRWVEEDDHR